MALMLDTEHLLELMRSLYTLTGIRFVLFDGDFKEVLSYPAEDSSFCRMMKCHPATRRKCRYADRRSFERCEKENRLVLYRCHAGLVEATIPLHENDRVIGYLMFGQITDQEDKAALLEQVPYWQQRCAFDGQALRRSIADIPCKSEEQIHAAAQIMEACTGYILFKELIRPTRNKLLEAAKVYIEEHLSEEIDIGALCKQFSIGRTKLYEVFREGLGMGVATYIQRRRLHRAKKLLKDDSLSVPQVAHAVGFDDYNYFSRVFKKTYGRSPRSYRK